MKLVKAVLALLCLAPPAAAVDVTCGDDTCQPQEASNLTCPLDCNSSAEAVTSLGWGDVLANEVKGTATGLDAIKAYTLADMDQRNATRNASNGVIKFTGNIYLTEQVLFAKADVDADDFSNPQTMDVRLDYWIVIDDGASQIDHALVGYMDYSADAATRAKQTASYDSNNNGFAIMGFGLEMNLSAFGYSRTGDYFASGRKVGASYAAAELNDVPNAYALRLEPFSMAARAYSYAITVCKRVLDEEFSRTDSLDANGASILGGSKWGQTSVLTATFDDRVIGAFDNDGLGFECIDTLPNQVYRDFGCRASNLGYAYKGNQNAMDTLRGLTDAVYFTAGGRTWARLYCLAQQNYLNLTGSGTEFVIIGYDSQNTWSGNPPCNKTGGSHGGNYYNQIQFEWVHAAWLPYTVTAGNPTIYTWPRVGKWCEDTINGDPLERLVMVAMQYTGMAALDLPRVVKVDTVQTSIGGGLDSITVTATVQDFPNCTVEVNLLFATKGTPAQEPTTFRVWNKVEEDEWTEKPMTYQGNDEWEVVFTVQSSYHKYGVFDVVASCTTGPNDGILYSASSMPFLDNAPNQTMTCVLPY